MLQRSGYAIVVGTGRSASITVYDDDETINLVAGLNNGIVWPGARVSIVSAIASLPTFQSAYWWNAGTELWHVYIHGAPDFVNEHLPLSEFRTGYTYSIKVSAAADWVVTAAPASTSSRQASASPPADVAPGPVWTATVTCDDGPGPVAFTAPTEEGAIRAAGWVINAPQGCGGAGTYTTTPPPAPDGQ